MPSSFDFELVLVRHGLTDWNEDGRLMGRIDVAINERGRAQAERVAEALQGFRARAVVSSPQLRARQTAEPIAAAQGLDVATEPELDEVWLHASWQGKKVAELRGDEELERLLADASYRSERIESTEQVMARSVGAVERLKELHPESTVMAVSHGDPLRTIVAHYLGLGPEAIRRVTIDNGAVTILRFTSHGPCLTVLNWTPEL